MNNKDKVKTNREEKIRNKLILRELEIKEHGKLNTLARLVTSRRVKKQIAFIQQVPMKKY